MKYTMTCGMNMSKLALGTAGFGSSTSEETAFALMDRYFEAGGNVLDSARCYSYWLPNGENASERTVGRYLRSRGLRDKTILSTKGGHPPVSDMLHHRINRAELTKDMEESLHYLDTDYIDIYYLHRDDTSKPVSEIMPILHDFVKSGKTRFLGASNWTSRRIEEANLFAEQNGMTPFSFSQPLWSYADINFDAFPDKTLYPMDDTEYAWYKKNDFSIMAYSSQAQGFFTAFAEKGLDGLDGFYSDRYINEKTLKKCEKVIRLAKETGISPTAISLNYLIYNRVNTVPIIGPSRMTTLEDSLRCFELPYELAKELFESSDDIMGE